MISHEGEFRNGKKYAELAYLLPISGNSGVQKRMAHQEMLSPLSLMSPWKFCVSGFTFVYKTIRIGIQDTYLCSSLFIMGTATAATGLPTTSPFGHTPKLHKSQVCIILWQHIILLNFIHSTRLLPSSTGEGPIGKSGIHHNIYVAKARSR